MEVLITTAVQALANQGPLFLGLAVAIYYLKQSDEKKAAVIGELIEAMSKERAERIDILEKHVEDCNQRHADAQAKYEVLLMRVAKIDSN